MLPGIRRMLHGDRVGEDMYLNWRIWNKESKYGRFVKVKSDMPHLKAHPYLKSLQFMILGNLINQQGYIILTNFQCVSNQTIT